MAHRTVKPLRAVGALLRALVGLALLIALVGGVPLALLAFGHQPTEVSGGLNMLLEQDDGTLWLVALTCIGWAAWAAFAFSVALEVVAVARRRSAPRIRGLGNMQSLASFLVGGIVLLAPTAASAATTMPAVAVTQTLVGPSSSATATPTSTPTADATFPTHKVTSATETPWDLAEQYLGNGQRWRDIAALNPYVPQLASGDQYLPKDAVIKLPLDARPATPAAAPSPAPTATPAAAGRTADASSRPHAEHPQSAGEETPGSDRSSHLAVPRHDQVTIDTGDSLWSIAGNEYGDPTAWKEIYEANRGEAQPGGGHFDNPDLIYPGQKLDLPGADHHDEAPADPATGHQDPHTTTPHHKPTDTGPGNRTAPTAGDQDTGHGQQHQAPPAATTPAPSASRTAEPSTAAPHTTAPTDTASPAPAAQPHQDSESPLSTVMLWTGTGVVAAALVGTLAVRRRRQQHRRRPGRRIAMPTGRAAATEQGLRSVQTPTGFDLLNAALRCLAGNLQEQGRKLPVLNAAVLHKSRLELHLAEDTPPCAPFTASAGRQDLWTCTANHPDLADENTGHNVGAPYPALVSIGWDPQGRYVLIDLEHIGLLHLDGDPDFARHVLQAIAVELANTPVAGHLEITALGTTVPHLETAVPERVARAEDADAARAELVAHASDQRSALSKLGADSPRAARLRDDTGGDWTPHILLAEQLPDEPATDNLLAALTESPRTASAIITAHAPAGLPGETWTLTCQSPYDTVVLPGSGLPVRLQTLDDDRFHDAIELLTTADSDSDEPAPDWMQPDNDDRLSDDGADSDGLPDEYAALEQEALEAETPAPGFEKHPATAQDAPAANPATTGESLADVLGDDESDDVAPAAGPADISLALTSPCTTPASAVHVTIPEPDEPAADSDAPTTASGGESLADVLALDGDDTDDAPAPAQAERVYRPRKAPDAQPAAPIPAPAVPAPNTAKPDQTPSGPAVLLLGPITITGASGRVDSNRKSVASELLAFLALNPGSDHHAVDAALWPASRVNKEMRNAVISRTRSWLGTDADGNQHLPRVQNTPDKRYRLGPHVTCDWVTFQQYARHGLAEATENGDLALRRALALVRGRPFAGMDPQRYAWAEPTIQEMISAITDVASELSTRRREADDIPGALWAARQGMLAVEDSETLYRALFLAHHAAGDIDALREAAARLRRINDSIGGGVEMEPDTEELLRNLLPRPIHTR
ncbi:LysM peptidoglycan-binding domain-containing protein [Streptomyces sp. NPDC001817]|uniref:LysM peptidoglycan-binding domain-containing protein n=1 Tax=Streptomyces sp. NPDC001817 TaxID=3154398 RepID=UPI0033282B8B